MIFKKTILAVVAALGFASAAHATDLSGNITVSSDYRYRGVSQTNVGPEVSGNLDVTDKSGLYAGTFFSNVSSEYYTGGAGYEEDFYVGYKHEVAKGLTLDVGSYTDTYFHAKNGNVSYTTSEAYLAATYGPVTVKGSHSFTNYFGIPNTHGTHYVTADVSQPVGPVTLIAHYGHTFTAHHNNYDYNDINFGASYNLPKGFTVTGLYYVNTNEGAGMKAYNSVNGHGLYGNNFVVSLKKNF